MELVSIDVNMIISANVLTELFILICDYYFEMSVENAKRAQQQIRSLI